MLFFKNSYDTPKMAMYELSGPHLTDILCEIELFHFRNEM